MLHRSPPQTCPVIKFISGLLSILSIFLCSAEKVIYCKVVLVISLAPSAKGWLHRAKSTSMYINKYLLITVISFMNIVK